MASQVCEILRASLRIKASIQSNLICTRHFRVVFVGCARWPIYWYWHIGMYSSTIQAHDPKLVLSAHWYQVPYTITKLGHAKRGADIVCLLNTGLVMRDNHRKLP